MDTYQQKVSEANAARKVREAAIASIEEPLVELVTSNWNKEINEPYCKYQVEDEDIRPARQYKSKEVLGLQICVIAN